MSTTTPSHSGERRKSRKGLIGITAIGVAGVLVAGLGFAYFSDSLTFGGTATAGSLDLTGTVTDASVANFNPGDVAVSSGTVTNAGNKEAWIRTNIAATTVDTAIAPYIYVFSGETVPSQADLLAMDLSVDTTPADGTPDALASEDSYVGRLDAMPSAGYDSEAEVINGTGANAETTNGTTDTTGEYDVNVEVYFDKAAQNDAQLKTFTLAGTVQAIQYRNNTDLSTVDWSSVAAPFTLSS